MAFLDKVLRWKKKPFGGDEKDGKKKARITALSSVNSSDSATSFDKGSGKFSHVLTRPHISEKAVTGEAQGQYVFEVVSGATKQEVALAVRDLYGVMPKAVNMISMAGKQLRFGRTSGATKHWKKAIITLPKGKTIDVYKK